ncbi:MAG: ABC transporter substrate-binding protein [Rhodospirillales bacterium]|nr:ABC transporter substrate-binding protein [Rhodospirillales bacterium]
MDNRQAAGRTARLCAVVNRAATACALLAGLLIAGAGAAQDQKLIVVAGGATPFLDQLFIARTVGFFKDEGVDVTVQHSTGAQQGLQLVANGNGDLFMGVLDPYLIGWEKGLRGKVIFFTRKKLIYTVAVPADSPIKEIKDLAGKKIGVPNLAGGMIPIVKSMVKLAGDNPSNLTFVPVGINDQALAALTSRQVDALAIWDTMYWNYERLGYKFRYLEHQTLAGFGNGMAFANDAAIARKADALCRFGRAYAEAALFLKVNPEASLKLWWKANPSARPAKSEREALDLALPAQIKTGDTVDVGFPPDKVYGEGDRRALALFTEALQQDGRMSKAPSVDDVYTDQFISCINRFDAASIRQRAASYKVE